MVNSRIRRIPGATDVSTAPSLRPSGFNPGIDVGAQFEGGAALAGGLASMARGIGQAGADIANQERAADVAAADAAWLKGSLDIGNRFERDGDYATFDKRVSGETQALRDEIAKGIRDPQTQQAWLQQTELKRISLIDAVNDRGSALSADNDRSKLTESITSLAELIADPTTPQVIRDAARANIDQQLTVAAGSALLTPSQADALRRTGFEVANENLAINRVKIDILTDPQRALTRLGIPAAGDDGTGVAAALASSYGGAMPQMDVALAKITAEALGDVNLPDDPKLIAAYLSDPDKAAEYVQAAAAMLNDRYDGDLTAVAIALDPEGGTVLADQWAKSHSDANLPAALRTRLRATMSALKSNVTGERLSIVAGPDVDVAGTDVAVLDRYETLQGAFGEQLPLLSAHRSAEHNKAVGGADKSQHIDGRALDIDVSSLSEERRIEFIQMASAMGFTGIGVYKNSIHLDTGDLRAWGPDYHKESVPGWAADAIAAHIKGDVLDVPLASKSVDPRYADIPFDKRLVLAGEARRAMSETNVTMKASLETIAANAPAAIANTGIYDGRMPEAREFVQVYGAADGIEKYKAFQAAVDTSKIMFGFKTQSTDAIMAAVQAAAPTSTGNDAQLESQRFDVIAAAAETVLKERNADPAGYVINAFPKVEEAWKRAADDPAAFSEALNLMAMAQDSLGIDVPELLPKAMAAQATAQFNDASLPAADRVNAVAQIIMRTEDEKQQKAIFDQLLKSGLPDYTQGAVAAMVRGDTAGAQNLMRAVMIDPEKLAGALPGGITPSQINSTIQDRIFQEGEIGDVLYGLTGGGVDNLERIRADSTLIERDVRLHLIDGSAGGDLNKAIDLTVKDMYGEVQVVRGNSVKVAIPKGEDPEAYTKGFTGLRSTVADAMRADMRNGMLQILGEEVKIEASGMAGVVKMGVDNAVSQVLAEGYFINAGGTDFQFFNPFTGTVVGKSDGTPLLFSKSDVLAAGTGIESQNAWQAAAQERQNSGAKW